MFREQNLVHILWALQQQDVDIDAAAVWHKSCRTTRSGFDQLGICGTKRFFTQEFRPTTAACVIKFSLTAMPRHLRGRLKSIAGARFMQTLERLSQQSNWQSFLLKKTKKNRVEATDGISLIGNYSTTTCYAVSSGTFLEYLKNLKPFWKIKKTEIEYIRIKFYGWKIIIILQKNNWILY